MLRGLAVGLWRELRRSTRMPVEYRAPAAIDADDEISRRRKVAAIANRLAEVLGDYPKDWAPDVLYELAWLLNVEVVIEGATGREPRAIEAEDLEALFAKEKR